MSWIREEVRYSWLDRLLINILKRGQLPRHVAFIMDGNRRFARRRQVRKIEGHSQGFEKLAETLQWCREFGITEVTVYAFSIENFKRSDDEVSGLLDLAKDKFQQLVCERDKLAKHGVRVKVIGNLSYLPQDLQDLIRQAMAVTQDNNNCTLNVAFSYTAREEIVHAVQEAAKRVSDGVLDPAEVSANTIEEFLYTNHCLPLDLLIRTSGESRLSDFLLWQSSFSVTYFTDVLWPEFSLRYLMAAIFHYQRQAPGVEAARRQGGRRNGGPDILEQDAGVVKLIEKLGLENVQKDA